MELLGTSTGFPFGAYSYTSFLGFKIADRVPYSIPLSWFYMGFTCFVLASMIVARWRLRHSSAWSLALGAYFLTVWDLALDPAMANPYLPLHFWIWHETGPYFGMPIRNLVGWSLTGLAFMGVSRLFWRTNLDVQRITAWLPFGMYVANIGFAIALNLSAGLWLPPLMAVMLGIVPASLALLSQPKERGQQPPEMNDSVTRRISQLIVRTSSWAMARNKVEVVVEGLECVPRSGPVLIVARHFHHLYDGCVLMKAVPRHLHILVALDWIQKRWLRGVMERACALVGWPALLRVERLKEREGKHSSKEGYGPYSLDEAWSYLRRAVSGSVQLLRNGEVLVVFPEAYPNIDPTFTPKDDVDAFLPFRPGFAKLVEMAEKDGSTQVAIVPAGLTYVENRRWHATLRFGPALSRDDYDTSAHLVQTIERQVHALSNRIASSASIHIEETIRL
jgi:putative membrane protein